MNAACSLLLKATGVAAVAAALAAGSATAAKLITGKDIKNGSITAIDIKKGSLKADRLDPSLRRSLTSRATGGGAAGPIGPQGAGGAQGPAGVQGVAGPQGDTGAPGVQGERGPSTAHYKAAKPTVQVNQPSESVVVELQAPPGASMIYAKATVSGAVQGIVTCTLETGANIVQDKVQAQVGAEPEALTLMTHHSNGPDPSDDDLWLRCDEVNTGTTTVSGAKITAIGVAQMDIQD